MRSSRCSSDILPGTAAPSPARLGTSLELPWPHPPPGRRAACASQTSFTITPPLRGSRRSQAARRRLMRWGANQRLMPRLQHILTGVGAPLFPVLVECGHLPFPPPARLRASPLSLCRLPLKGGVIRLVMFEAKSQHCRGKRVLTRISHQGVALFSRVQLGAGIFPSARARERRA